MQIEITLVIQLVSLAAFVGGMWTTVQALKTVVDELKAHMRLQDEKIDGIDSRLTRVETVCITRHREEPET